MNKKAKELATQLTNDTAALILSAPNRYYITGVSLSEGAVFITKTNIYLLADSRYYEMAQRSAKDISVIKLSNLISQINDLIKENNIKSIMLEKDYVSISAFENYKSRLNAAISTEKNFQEFISNMREQKDDLELSSIIAAQEITDKTFSYILNRISVGKTEKQIMLDMEFYSRNSGSEGVAFDFIVVSGKNSSLPHGVPTDKIIENGDFITMDFGAVVNGYRSDMTRTVAIGEITDEQINVYNTVLKAQNAAIDSAKAGMKCSSLDNIAREIIDNAGYKGYFGHALGHGVGIDIHEKPTLSPKSEDILKIGNIITVEPGIYIPGKFGVRIEDMLFITESGNNNLTKSKKELIIL